MTRFSGWEMIVSRMLTISLWTWWSRRLKLGISYSLSMWASISTSEKSILNDNYQQCKTIENTCRSSNMTYGIFIIFKAVNIKMSLGSLSYLNGKYQGLINSQKQRQGLGILIDDDLTFHVSNWVENKMQGATLVYLAHAKYIYGEWKNNQPHGLNVYRSGDTVLLSKYIFGVPSNRCLLIFERHSFAYVLGEHNKQWEVVKSGMIVNHGSLMKFIELLQIDVPDHYLSLIKFSCAFSNHNQSIKTFPCHQNYCYFGFLNGLAIIFNNNNGLVSVGHHKNEELYQFGGKFTSKRNAQQGNFSSGETVEYRGERPIQKIYKIYQRMHKKDVCFINQMYESKTKIFNSIHWLIINKFKQIIQESKKESNNRFDLDESLDYKEYNEEQSLKLYEIRDKMYSPPKKVFERHNNSPYTPTKNNRTSRTSQSLLKKQLKKSIRVEVQTFKNAKQLQVKRNFQNKTENTKHSNPFNILFQENFNQFQQTSSFKKIIQQEENQSNKASEKKYNETILEQPKLLKLRIQKQQNINQNGKLVKLKRQRSVQHLARPTYENIEARRKRLLKEFQQLNVQSSKIQPVQESPFKQQLASIQKQQSSFSYIPLSISNRKDKQEGIIRTVKKSDRIGKIEDDRQNKMQQRPQEKSSNRRSGFNYGNIDSRNIKLAEKEMVSGSQTSQQQSTVSPLRPKRTYQYMYQ